MGVKQKIGFINHFEFDQYGSPTESTATDKAFISATVHTDVRVG